MSLNGISTSITLYFIDLVHFYFLVSCVENSRVLHWLLSSEATLNFSTGWKRCMFLPLLAHHEIQHNLVVSFLTKLTDFDTE